MIRKGNMTIQITMDKKLVGLMDRVILETNATVKHPSDKLTRSKFISALVCSLVSELLEDSVKGD